MRQLEPEKTKLSHGQATIEYVLLMASVVVVFSAFLSMFHTEMAHYLFSFVGQLLPGEK